MKKNEKAARVLLIVFALVAIAAIIAIAAQAVDILSNVSGGNLGSNGGGTSGIVAACKHENTEFRIEKANQVNHKKVTFCNDCHKDVSDILVRHEWDNGPVSTCAVCGQECVHVQKAVAYITNRDGTHRVDERCEVCGYLSKTYTTAVCTLGANGCCTLCGYSCQHDKVVTSGGKTFCNNCGKDLAKVWISFGFGNAEANSFYFVKGQTWQDALYANPRTLSDIMISLYTSGPGDYSIALTRVADSTKTVYLYVDGVKVQPTDVIKEGVQYGIGISAQFKSFIIGDHNDITAPRLGYEEGWTWGNLARVDNLWWNDPFTVNANGYICDTSTGALLMCDGSPVSAAARIDGTKTYTYE